MTESKYTTELLELKERADRVWEKSASDTSVVSELLGSSEADLYGQDYWLVLSLSSFVAPNFFIEREHPVFIEALNCLKVGEDRDDCPLYYFLSNGAYAVSTNKGLLLVATSTHIFFETFVLYAEWVEEIVKDHGSNSLREYQFSINNLIALEARLKGLLNENFEHSFWQHEIMRLRKNMEAKAEKGSESV